jgi:hypothetical protein
MSDSEFIIFQYKNFLLRADDEVQVMPNPGDFDSNYTDGDYRGEWQEIETPADMSAQDIVETLNGEIKWGEEETNERGNHFSAYKQEQGGEYTEGNIDINAELSYDYSLLIDRASLKAANMQSENREMAETD